MIFRLGTLNKETDRVDHSLTFRAVEDSEVNY